MRDLWDFFLAAGFLGGGSVILAIILFTVAVIEHYRDRNVGATWLFVIGCLAFCFGAFSAWQEERRAVGEKSSEVTKLKRELDSLKESQISAKIEFGILGNQPSGSSAGIIVSLKNAGAASSIAPDSWKLTAVTADGRTYEGWANTLKDKNLDFCFGSNTIRRFVKSDALYLKASSAPIAHNGYLQGFLWFAFHKLSGDSLKSLDTKLVLSATTVSGQSLQSEIAIEELKKRSSQATQFFAGIENPNPINEPCKENQPY